MGYSSPTLNDVDDGEEDAHGTQVGQGEEGDRLGVGRTRAGTRRVWRGRAVAREVEVERAERAHTDSVQLSWSEARRTAKAAASARRCMPSLASSEDT